MYSFDKSEIRSSITLDMVFELLADFGGDPEYTSFGIVSSTICHNPPGVGSRKLYFYTNTTLFHCYSGCEDPSFDVFTLVIKVFKIQKGINIDLNYAIRYVAEKFGILLDYVPEDEAYSTEDWKILNTYDRLQSIDLKDYHTQLKEYDSSILKNFNYSVRIKPWLDEGISKDILERNLIGYCASTAQITIPHFDKEGRFIGLRGRTLSTEEAEKYGKYRPIKINGIQYSHPLGMNLYNLNNSKDNIKTIKKAIVFEGEKSSLKYASLFGIENDFTVASCGSNLTAFQFQMLLDSGAEEIIIAFDRQFENLHTDECKAWIKKLKSIHEKYKNYATISIIFDKEMITGYKDSPVDCGVDKFLELFKSRIYL